MITINVQTKAVTLDRDTPIMARNQFGNATYGYVRGHLPPNYPVPAISEICLWDYVLFLMLEKTPAMTDEEWEREEDEWQDYLDSLGDSTP